MKTNKDIMRELEKQKDRAYNAQIEKNKFLGEYRERVIVALTKAQVEEKGVYPEIIEALKLQEAKNLKISRDIEFVRIKDYVFAAERAGVSFQLVDGISYCGDIGLVVSSDKALDINPIDPVVKSAPEKFEEQNLNPVYYESMKEKICDYHKEIIHKELPEFEPEYRDLTFLDRVLGVKCPICEKLGGKRRG